MNEQLIHDNEQDREEIKRWWREASNAVKMAVWDRIQAPAVDPLDEIVMRFAQIAFGEMAEKDIRP